MELRRLASEYTQQGLGAFLEQIALVSDQDTLKEGTNVPTLLTLHASKGLEFPIVMIAGLNDGVLPHSRSFEEPEEMMEERRLFYVGITRAENRLYLVYSQTRAAYGFSEPVEPSRFLDDIPYELINEVRSSRPRRISRSSQVYTQSRWHEPEAEPKREEPVYEQRYHPGMMVEHPSWGEGMVLNTRLQDSDEIVDIVFNGVGLKRVAASLANLQIKEK
jgi:DNA helicase-2/ATP-dependent DNA helicase PcrA